MAIYHASMKILGRQVKRNGTVVKGRCNSAVAASAYQGGLRLYDERNDRTHDYSRKGGVLFTTILLPEGAPVWMGDHERLWNAVEFKEDESNRHESAQLARQLEFALPVELTPEQNRALALGVGNEFVRRGMVTQVSVHEPNAENGRRNPHCHLMLTMREVTAEGFGKKNREWNGGWMAAGVPDGGALKGWRAMIAEHTNEALEEAGHDARVDARSYKDLGIDQVPTVHQGKEATALARKGERTRRGDKQKVALALGGTLASTHVQRAPEEGESGDREHGGGEVYEETRRQRHAPGPGGLETPAAWKSGSDVRNQKPAEREPER
jgi:ATP-dependent exoDNAse (exonuclease V) alpha subunit